MNSLPSILTANGFGVVLIAIVVINMYKNRRLITTEDKLFVALSVCIGLLCIVEPFSFCVEAFPFPGRQALIRTSNVLCFMLGAIPGPLWAIYVSYRVFSSEKARNRAVLFGAVGAISISFLAFMNLFFDIFFTVTPDDHYARTPFVAVSFAVFYVYFVYTLLVVYYQRKRIHKYLFFPIISFMIPPLVGTVIQISFYGLSLIWSASAISVVILYISLQAQDSAIDKLTGLYNRIYLDNYIRTNYKKAGENEYYAGIMMDIDRFKRINDTYGHYAGDRALEAFGSILIHSVGPRDFAARYAGDEFVILTKITDKEQLPALIRRIQKNADAFNRMGDRPYRLEFSYGWAIVELETDTPDSFLNRMDNEMYNMKSRKHLKREREPALPVDAPL